MAKGKRVIGSGAKDLEDFIKRCRAEAGFPQIRTKYAGKKFKNYVVVACLGAPKVAGGTIENITPEEALRIKEKLIKGVAKRISADEFF